MPSLNLLSTNYANSAACLCLAVPANLLLCWLILFRTNSQMRIWSRVLLQSALIDLILPSVTFLVQPLYFSDGVNFYCFLNGPLARSGQPMAFALVYLTVFWQEFAKYAIGVQFLYRWLVICRDFQLSSAHYALFLTIPAAMALSMILVEHLGWLWQGVHDPHCAACPPGSTVAFAIPANSLSYQAASALTFLLNLGVYLLILVCILQIWRRTRNSAMAQPQQHKALASRQVGYVLLVQALIPLCLSLLPLGFLLLFNLFDIREGRDWLPIFFYQSWSSVLYPVLTVLIVGQYRRALMELGKKSHLADNSVQQNHQQLLFFRTSASASQNVIISN